MDERSTLLPTRSTTTTKKLDVHPVALRVCHSAFSGFSQTWLIIVRRIIVLYMFFVFSMMIGYKDAHINVKWTMFFDLGNIAFIGLFIYQIVAYVWTWMHSNYPHPERHEPSPINKIRKFLSPPLWKDPFFFGVFYAVVHTIPWVAAGLYWFVIFPMNKPTHPAASSHPRGQQHKFHLGLNETMPIPDTLPIRELFSYGWAPVFLLANKYLVVPFLVIIEVFFLSSIKYKTPVFTHAASVSFVCSVYIWWAVHGCSTQDKCQLSFFSEDAVGYWRALLAYVAYNAAVQIAYMFLHVITHLRETWVQKKNEKKSGGHDHLPDN